MKEVQGPGLVSLIWALVWLVIQFDVWQCLSSESSTGCFSLLFSAAAGLLNYSDETTAETVD